MTRRMLAIVLVVLIVSSVFAPIGAVAAQEERNATETDGTSAEQTPRETAQTAESEEQKDEAEETTVVEEVDDNVRVTGYEYDREREVMTVGFANVGDESTRVTMTEVISERQASSGTMGVEMFRIRPDETMNVEIYTKSGAVMIVTEQSLERGQGTFLKDDSRLSLLSGPATWGLIRVSGLGGALGVLILAVLLGWHRIADSTDKVEVNA